MMTICFTRFSINEVVILYVTVLKYVYKSLWTTCKRRGGAKFFNRK
jgi:hypothetical protein